MSRGALFTTPLEFDLGASWCAGVIALLKSQSLKKYGTYIYKFKMVDSENRC